MNILNTIHGNNLSEAWAKATIECYNAINCTMAPVSVSFDVKEEDESWKLETPEIRKALETQLNIFNIVSANQSNVETVAGTIFPESIWIRCRGNRKLLFKKYNKMWPQVKKCPQNSNGTYFRRLVAYGEKGIPQLERIITTWEKNIRRHSAFQAGIFDPTLDHKGTPYLGFPCLQQVVFHPHGANGSKGMTVVAFYANQYLFKKAYGNYLGLYRLGKFMANEMGLKLIGVTCIASNLSLKYDKRNKRDFLPLVEVLKKVLPNDYKK